MTNIQQEQQPSIYQISDHPHATEVVTQESTSRRFATAFPSSHHESLNELTSRGNHHQSNHSLLTTTGNFNFNSNNNYSLQVQAYATLPRNRGKPAGGGEGAKSTSGNFSHFSSSSSS